MLCRRPESCTDHCAYYNRSDRFAAKHIAKFGSLIEDLIEADSHKIDEHEFHDRTQTARRCANGCSDEGRLGYGCIHDPISVFSIQPFGHAEYAAPGIPFSVGSRAADVVFTHYDDGFIATHFLSNRFVDSLFETNFSRHS